MNSKIITTILSITSLVGLGATIIVSRRDSKKEFLKLEELKKISENEKMTKTQLLKTYIPTIVVGGATALVVIGAGLLNVKQLGVIAGVTTLTTTSLAKYGSRFGINTNKLKNMAKEEFKSVATELKETKQELYFEEHIGFFRARPEDVLSAYINLNQRLVRKDPDTNGLYSTLGMFVEDCKTTVVNKGIVPKKYENVGWEMCSLEIQYETGSWVDMLTEVVVDKDSGEPYTIITWSQQPVSDVTSEDSEMITAPKFKKFELTKKKVK